MTQNILADQETYDKILSRIPKGQLSATGDLAGPIIFLCGEASGFITGQVLYVDGGWTCA